MYLFLTWHHYQLMESLFSLLRRQYKVLVQCFKPCYHELQDRPPWKFVHPCPASIIVTVIQRLKHGFPENLLPRLYQDKKVQVCTGHSVTLDFRQGY